MTIFGVLIKICKTIVSRVSEGSGTEFGDFEGLQKNKKSYLIVLY